MRRTVVLALALAAIVPSVAQARVAQHAATHKAALIARVNVAASEFKFVLSKKSAGRGIVIFKVTNVGAIAHDFSIDGRKTRMLNHGQSATLRVTFLRKGAYPYTCTVPGHAAAGMKGVFTIT
jgi:plastocyanin